MTAQRERVDVQRSKRRILDAAARVLADDPSLGIAAVADHAGVARATVYRHYPTRDELVAAMEAELVESAAAVIDEHTRASATVPEALGAIAESFVDVRFRVLFEWSDRAQAFGQDAKSRWDAPLLALIERGQATRELAADLPARALLVALAGLTRRALKAYVEGELTLDEARAVARRGLLTGFAGR